jgi:hypothetical protein
MTEFARRFLERRKLPHDPGGHARLATRWPPLPHLTNDLTLRIAARLSEEERHVLDRMMNHCPVHQALHGNVPVHIHVVPMAEEELRLAEEAESLAYS